MKQVSGIDVLDTFVPGPPFCTMGTFTLYQVGEPVLKEKQPSKGWSDLEPLLQLELPNPRTRSFFIRLTNTTARVSRLGVFETLLERFNRGGHRIVSAVGTLSDGSIGVFCKKVDYKSLPDLTFGPEVVVNCYRIVCSNVYQQQHCLSVFECCLQASVANFQMTASKPDQPNFEQIYAGTSNMSAADLEVLRAQIVCKPKEERTSADTAILRCYGSLVKIRAERRSFMTRSLVWSAASPPDNIVPERYLQGLNQTAVRLREQGGGVETVELREFLQRPELLSSHGLVVLGSNSTTGYGKTAFVKRLAAVWARARVRDLGLPDSTAEVAWANTLDDLRDIEFRRGMALVLDEVEISDLNAVQYVSEPMMKCILDPSASSCIRARNRNAQIPAGVARIFTANADSPQQWCGRRIAWTEPMQRKAFVAVITAPLVLANWSSAPDYNPGEW